MTSSTHQHLTLLKKSTKAISTTDGKCIDVFELQLNSASEAALKVWAKHFRAQYCLDDELDNLREGSGKSRRDFLLEFVFPSATTRLGPAVRSGDFVEVLVSDVLETQYGYWVPRTRHSGKMVRDESPRGSDILGFKLVSDADGEWSSNDILMVCEAKGQLSGKLPKARLQDAVDDSVKDALRKSESLIAAKRRLLQLDRLVDAKRVARFQDPLARPHIEHAGAAATFCSSVFDEALIQATDCSQHPNHQSIMLVVIHAPTLMKFVHSLYERAADEA